MSETPVTGPGRYKLFSLVRDSPVGVRHPGPGHDEFLRLNLPHSDLVINKSSAGCDFSFSGFRYIGLEERLPGSAVVATDDERKKVDWAVVYVPERQAYTIHPDFDRKLAWFVVNERGSESPIAVSAVEPGPPDSQLFRWERVV